MVKKIVLAFGAIGIVIPVLPTTPFCIIAGICFSASSERLYNWLFNSKVLGEFLRHYRDKTGVPLSYKIYSICFLWATLCTSIYFVQNQTVDIILVVVGLAITIHLAMIRTKKK
ncbi:MAG: YbaN family protein [Clostridia bacterium]